MGRRPNAEVHFPIHVDPGPRGLRVVVTTYRLSIIAQNIMAWSDMPDYFAVADGLTISGTSPELSATYNVVIVGFVPGGVAPALAAVAAGG